ncbi:MAG: hypothetical protein LBK07_00745 [Tannerella sp.]|jgi:hypothetical protein|nr:hypothetical protein [Tannerella sp.]
MKSILENPYRIAGLLVGASARERNTKIKRLRMYIEAGEKPPTEEDRGFPALGKLSRTSASLNEAASKLDLDSDRMHAALFWFYNSGSDSDAAAFDALARGDISAAAGIWQKLLTGTVTTHNSFAYLNCSTLQLFRSIMKTTLDASQFELAVLTKIKFLESNCLEDFVTRATDETFKTGKAELELVFLRTLMKDMEQVKGFTPAKMREIVMKLRFTVKNDFMKDFAQPLADEIEHMVEATAKKRKNDLLSAATRGNSLYKDTSDALKQLKEITGATDMKYTEAADRVANEIINCVVDCFQSGMEKIESPLNQLKTLIDRSRSMTVDGALALLAEAAPLLVKLKNVVDGVNISAVEGLLKKASGIAASSAARQRCEKNKEQLTNGVNVSGIHANMSSGIASKALDMIFAEIGGLVKNVERERDTLKKKVNDALAIVEEIERMSLVSAFEERLAESKETLTKLKKQLDVQMEIAAINELLGNEGLSNLSIIEEAKPHLRIIGNAMGHSDDTFLNISTAVASKALNACVALVNWAQKEFSDAPSYHKQDAIYTLKYCVDMAWGVTEDMGSLYLRSDFESRLRENKSSLSGLRDQLSQIDLPYGFRPSIKIPDSGRGNSRDSDSDDNKGKGFFRKLINKVTGN